MHFASQQNSLVLLFMDLIYVLKALKLLATTMIVKLPLLFGK